MMTAEQLIDTYLDEKQVKGLFLTGKQVAALSDKQHIFVGGKKAVVVTVNVDYKRKESNLVYVKGRKAFGKELDMVIPYNDMKTVVQASFDEPRD